MCYKVFELCPLCEAHTGAELLYKKTGCPSFPELCELVVELTLRPPRTRWADVTCREPDCLFGKRETHEIELEIQDLGAMIAINPPGGTESMLIGAPMPAGDAEIRRVVTQLDGRPARRLFGRSTSPNGRIPLPERCPSPTPEGSGSASLPRAIHGKRSLRSSQIPAGALAGPQASTPGGASNRIPTEHPTCPTSETSKEPNSQVSCGTARSGPSDTPRLKGPSGMQRVAYNQPSRDGNPRKIQHRSAGEVNLNDLPAEQADEIRDLKKRMDERIALQSSTGPAATSSSRKKSGHNYVLEEDQLIQLLRFRGFGFNQMHRDFLTRRTTGALVARRKNHRQTHVRGFVFIPDEEGIAFTDGDSETHGITETPVPPENRLKRKRKVIEMEQEEGADDDEISQADGGEAIVKGQDEADHCNEDKR